MLELHLDDRGAGGREDGCRQEEGGRGVDEDALGTGPDASVGDEADHRDDGQCQHTADEEDGSQEAARFDRVSQAATQPGAQRDPGEHGADDPGGDLDGDAQVGRQQADREDLERQHGGARSEDDQSGDDGSHG